MIFTKCAFLNKSTGLPDCLQFEYIQCADGNRFGNKKEAIIKLHFLHVEILEFEFILQTGKTFLSINPFILFVFFYLMHIGMVLYLLCLVFNRILVDNNVW